eukprot:CAMPEP_0194229316 /NCGR_PEP_ID=MMETSP0156-20130528/43828_1 /TAXON_ID=33649 /ORGANISM="Thalassionema nitzschioides, Strain L26-B" /LENGTH=765 /DNA_ID=CAMNT_0038961865 /DNA_START=77 /DNA_END=2371 /DNA_ORIENTATION=+
MTNNNRNNITYIYLSHFLGIVSMIALAICVLLFQHYQEETNLLREELSHLQTQCMATNPLMNDHDTMVRMKTEDNNLTGGLLQQQEYQPVLDSLLRATTQQQQPKAAQAEIAVGNNNNGRQLQISTSSFTFASEFGVVGDGTADDTAALQAALDSASNDDSGGIVILPAGVFFTTSRLQIPAGVTLQGQGYGSSPLSWQGDAGSSTIAYCGADYAIGMNGNSAAVEHVAIFDWHYNGCQHDAAGGIILEAHGRELESIRVDNVLLFQFTEGTALHLKATSQGRIAYANFQNVRIRQAKRGISLEADEDSFVHSNTWLAGAMSGGGFEVGIIANATGACNENIFYGAVVETSTSDLAHVYVEGNKTNLKLVNARLEGIDQPIDRPLVKIHESSYGNEMTGILGHTYVDGNLNRNPGIRFMEKTTVGLDPLPQNQFWNAAFKGYDATTNSLPGWSITTNANLAISTAEEPLYPDHLVLDVQYLGYGGVFKLQASGLPPVPGHDHCTFGIYAKSTVAGSISAADHLVLDVQYLGYGGVFKLQASGLPPVPGHDHCTFGIYAKSTVAGSISAAMRYTSGSITSSASHAGDGEWQFIGMTSLYDKSAPSFYFSIDGNVQLTAPTLVFGKAPATPGGSLISSSGARMAGTLSYGMATSRSSCPNWVLPVNEGNVFNMDLQGDPTGCTITTINESAADRFPKGSTITLLFSEAGTRVQSNLHLKLKGDFVSSVNSALTLMSALQGNAEWTEVSRAAPQEYDMTYLGTGRPSL